MHKNPDEIEKELRERIPKEAKENYQAICEIVQGFNSFDLISSISFYNSLHDVNSYSDYRGDRHFFVAEVIALICLKNEFIKETKYTVPEFHENLQKLQKLTLEYCVKKQFSENLNSKRDQNLLSEIAQNISNEELSIRNPGHPEHHFIFSEILYSKIDSFLLEELGFTSKDSVAIRKSISQFINERYSIHYKEIKKEAHEYANEAKRYRKSNKRNEGSNLTIEQFKELSTMHYNEMVKLLTNSLGLDLFYHFSKVYTFTAEELSEYAKIPLEHVKSFLDLFSCKFPAVGKEYDVYSANSILKTTPILKNLESYVVPSIPQLTWAVESVIESTIKNSNKKIKNKWSTVRHDFLLEQSLEYFKRILPNAEFLPTNLYYNYQDKPCETDSIIIYDKVLFILEAKGHKISEKSKQGHELKTKDHLDDIIEDSYKQGIRTLKYIDSNKISEFKTKNGKKYEIERNKFDDVVLVTLTLEPIGNLSMHIKATNKIGYFNNGHFPWIISIYDLVVIADLFYNPLLFIHYIKRRKAFLSHDFLHTHEELDLIAYYQYNYLDTSKALKSVEDENMNYVYYGSETDQINDYYMYKFGQKSKFTPKPPFFIHSEFDKLLLALDESCVEHRTKIALMMLELSQESIKQLMTMVIKTKHSFKKDRGLHDCSLFTESGKGFGITYMTNIDKDFLDFKLYQYCIYKLRQLNSNAWIGIGDTALSSAYKLDSIFIVIKENIILKDIIE
jgi:hypothetical protein